ncbi:helix-turn-helix domain-containing protein [Streptomyces sp. NPDC003393]
MSEVSIWDRRTWRVTREAKGVTYGQLAEACQVYHATPEKWFRGEREPRLSHQIKMAKALGLPLDSILSQINDPAVRDAIRDAYNN